MSTRQASPADATNLPTVTEHTRVPMSVPVSKLAVPEIPGFHLHWWLGTPQRIQRALNAGYVFVENHEVLLNNAVLGSDPTEGGNTDLGTRVSQVAGAEIDNSGQAVRLYLMKIKEEWWQKDQAALTAPGSRIDGVRRSLLGGLIGAEQQTSEDRAQIYVDPRRTKIPEYLKRRAS